MRVRDIMTTTVVTARPDTSYKQAVDLLLSHEVSGLPVVDDDNVVVGMVTEADLVPKRAYANGRRRRPLQVVADILTGRHGDWPKSTATAVGQLMSTGIVFANPDEGVAAVARRMLDAAVKRVPVVDREGRLVGVVSRHDVLGAYLRPDSVIAEDVRRTLGDPFSCPETASVQASVDEGVVTLRGEVQWPSDRRVVTAAAWRVPGVVDVLEVLRSREPEPTSP